MVLKSGAIFRGIRYIGGAREDYNHLSYVRLQRLVRLHESSRFQMAKKMALRASRYGLVALAIIVLHSTSGSSDVRAEVVLAYWVLFAMFVLPTADEVIAFMNNQELCAELKRRNAQYRVAGAKFQVGKTVYVKRDERYGVVTAPAKLSRANEVRRYSVLFLDNEQVVRVDETQLESWFDSKSRKAEALAKKHKAVLALLGFLVTMLVNFLCQ
jgi:hypothetical protein